jgi:hypothetical protein
LKHWSWAGSKHLAGVWPVFGLVFLTLATSVQAAPDNDDFLNAKALSGPPLSVEFDDNKGATKQAGEPTHAGNAGGHSVWYSWTPSVDAYVVISTCTLGPGIDTLLAVYTGSGVDSLTPVASNDERAEDRCHSIDSEVAFEASAGTTYRIAVDGKAGSEGDFELVLRGTPPNDEFDNAEKIEPGAFLSGDTSFASKEAGEPKHAGAAGGNSVWYSWTPSNSGPAVISTCTLGGSLDPVLAVYTGSAVDSLTPVASGDEGAGICSTGDSKAKFDASAGTTYRIAVDGEGGSEGGFEIRLKARPDNDEFADAKTLAGSLPGTIAGSTAQATKQAGEPNHAGNAGGHSVWYSWTPSSSGPVNLSICSNLLDGSLNSLLVVYTGSTIGGLTPVASNDDAGVCWSTDSALDFTASAGTTYRIAVDGKGGSAGDFHLAFKAFPGDGGGGGSVGGGGSSLPPPPVPAPPAASVDKPKQLQCKRGFRKKMLRGKARCVKKKKGKRRR